MAFFAVLVTASLLWHHNEGSPVSPRPINELLLELGHRQECSSDKECGDVDAIACVRSFCKCREANHVLSSSTRCLPVKQLGEECLEDVQCRVLEKNATCEDKFCACDSGSYLPHDANGTLCTNRPAGGIEETKRSAIDINMIIIITSLAIMFIGICVALHLFSKARFRNRRSIFNSPHPRLIQKLGKRRKSSVRTQHLPPPGMLVPRHHSFSGHHSPFPVSKVPKTRSHECLRSALSRESSPKFEPRPKTAPLAEWESLPSNEDLEKKTPEPLQNGLPSLLTEEESQPKAPGSPTVIITDADGAHTVVTSTTQSPSSAVNV
ncbi:uncharacterized protein [Parasteatoda tepidariorum]|uniref:uncharacterized protein n=1 Tax=Parasteatoda tepidariorum TaxID=114398 RepID=UPI001C727031|nr:uncharacterized protein LOC107452715 [Parasteatoda tepidariorum]